MLQRLARKAKIERKLLPYSWRHTFATRWLLAGGSIKILADLMGNSVAISDKQYGHLEVDKKVMRQRLLEVRTSIEAEEAKVAKEQAKTTKEAGSKL
jgi:site-specific recombinase XerD